MREFISFQGENIVAPVQPHLVQCVLPIGIQLHTLVVIDVSNVKRILHTYPLLGEHYSVKD